MELKPILVQFHVIMNNVLFPINDQNLIPELAKSGYQPAHPGNIIKNQLVIQQGDIAVKNNTVLTTNSQSKMIQLSGLTPQEVYETWKEIENILLNQNINIKTTGRLFELKSEYIVKTGKNPLKSFRRVFNNVKLEEKFNHIITGKPSTLVSLRFMPQDGVVDTEDFYDIKIEPVLRNQKSEYFIQILYRNKKQEITEKILLKLEEKIKEIITLIDSQ
ncbi:MAG: hypothetical protein KGZ37_04325 [Nitrosarchaeum sp.]|nr:hypothetical protein [Nitrosarchaeum sp.]